MSSSISSQSLFNRVSTEFQIRRLNTIDPSKFTQSIIQMSDNISRDKNYEKSLEWLRTYVASLQAKLNSLVEELNNLYDLMLTEAMYKRADSKNTARLVNNTRNAADAPQFDYMVPHPAGDSGKGLAPYDAYLQTYYYNPFFGSRAMDFNSYLDQKNPKDLDVARTYYENVGNTHHELGSSAFGTIGYLWLWDVDRINSSYATTMDRFMDANGDLHVPTYDPLVGQPGVIGDPTLDLKPNTPPYDEDFNGYSDGVNGINELSVDGWLFGGDGVSQAAPFNLASTYGWVIGDNGYINSLGANAYGNGNNNVPGWVGKALVQTTNSDRAFAFGGNDNWDNYTFEGTIGKVNGDDDWTRVWVRHQGASDQHGYMIQVHWNDTTTISIYKVDNGVFTQKATVDTGVNLGSGQNDAHWMRMKIVANGNKIDVYAGQIDRVPPESFNPTPSNEIDKPDPPAGYTYTVSYTDTDANYEEFLEGKIGLSSSSQASWFDALRIRGLPPDSNLLQVNVTAVQPNRGAAASSPALGDMMGLDTSLWPGYQPGEIEYETDGTGYNFTPEPLFLKVTGFDSATGRPQYEVVKADGTPPVMEVLTGVANQTLNLPDFGTYNAGAMANGASAFGGWVNRTGETIADGAGSSSGYWNTGGYGGPGGGATHVSYQLNFPNPVLQGPGETVNVAGQLYADDGWTINTKPGNFTTLPAAWAQNGSGGGSLAATPSLSGNLNNDPDTDGTWTRVYSMGGNLPGTAASRTIQQGVTAAPFSANSPASAFNSQSMTFLVTGIDGSPAGWAGGGPTASGLWADLSVTARTITGTTTVPRYVVDEWGNIRDRFGIVGANGSYGHTGGSTQQSNANVRPDTPYDASGGDDEELYDYVPHHDIVDPALTDKDLDIVSSVQSDFIYYREKLDGRFVDGPQGASNLITNWNVQESDKTAPIVQTPFNANRPNISFDPRGTNVLGRFDVNNGRVQVLNTDAAMFGNTLLTYVEQNPSNYNTQKQDSYAVWNGLSGHDQVGNNDLNSDNADDYSISLNFDNKDRNGVGILSAIKRVHVKVTGEPTIQSKRTAEYDSLIMGGTSGYKPLGLDMTYGYIDNILQTGGSLSNVTLDTVNLTYSDTYLQNFDTVNAGTPVPGGWTYTGVVQGQTGYPNIVTGSAGTVSYTLTNTENFNSGMPAGWAVTGGTVQMLAGYPNIRTGSAASASSSLRSVAYPLNADTTEVRVSIDSACLTGGCGHAYHGAPTTEYLRTMRVRFNDGTFTDVDLTTNNDVDVSTAAGPTVPSTTRTFVVPIPAGKTSASYEFIQTTNDMGHGYTHEWTIDNLRIEQGKPAVQSASSSIRSTDIPLQFADTTRLRITIDSACLTGGCGHASHGPLEYVRTMRVRWSDGTFTDVDLTTNNNVDVDTVNPGPTVPNTSRSFLVDLPASGSTTANIEFIQTTNDLTHLYVHNWTIDNLRVEEGRPTANPKPDTTLYTDAFGTARLNLVMNPDAAIVNDGTVRVDVSYIEDQNLDGKLDNTPFTGQVLGRSYRIDPATGQPLANAAGQINIDHNYAGVPENEIVRIKTIGLDDLHADGGWSGTSQSLTNRTASMWVNGDRTGVDWFPHIGNHIQGTDGNRIVFKKSYYNNTGAPLQLDVMTGINAGADFRLNGVSFANEWVTQNSPHTITLVPGRNDFEIRAWDDQQTDSYVQLYTPNPRAGINIRADETWQVSSLTGPLEYDRAPVVNRFEMTGNDVLANENTNSGYNKAQEVYENFLVVGNGRSGGATQEDNDNRVTKRLKQIIDDPTFQEVLRFRLFDETYVAATVSDNRGDQIVGKLILDWDWRRRRINVKQGSFSAVFKA